ncbi:unnamed protein product [Cochlearia groenlandica]
MAAKKPSLSELYATWSKTLTEICLPLLRHSLSAASANITTVLRHIDSYYDDLDGYADPNTILYILFPPRRSSLEMPLLFLGDIDPRFLTCVIASLLNRYDQEDPHEPYPDLTNFRQAETRIHEIKTEISRHVDHLLKRAREANESYVEIVSESWMLAQPRRRRRTVMETVLASDPAAKGVMMKELVSVFVDANRLRKRVIHEIVDSTTSANQKTLFLASLCEFLASFNDQHTIEPENERTLWMEDVTEDMSNEFLYKCFSETGEVVSATCMRHKQTGNSKGYGFIVFLTSDAAKKALERYDNTPIPAIQSSSSSSSSSSSHTRHQLFRLNWSIKASGHGIFVGDLSEDATTSVLRDKFKACYNSVKATRVVMDKETGRSKGYGFVTFADKSEHDRALIEMNGRFCLGRRMRIVNASRN